MRVLRALRRYWYLRGVARRATAMQLYREKHPSPTLNELKARGLFDYWKETRD